MLRLAFKEATVATARLPHASHVSATLQAGTDHIPASRCTQASPARLPGLADPAVGACGDALVVLLCRQHLDARALTSHKTRSPRGRQDDDITGIITAEPALRVASPLARRGSLE